MLTPPSVTRRADTYLSSTPPGCSSPSLLPHCVLRPLLPRPHRSHPALPLARQVNFFVLAVQTLTELRISLQRIDAFLSTPEPPRPGQAATHGSAAAESTAAASGPTHGSAAAATAAATRGSAAGAAQAPGRWSLERVLAAAGRRPQEARGQQGKAGDAGMAKAVEGPAGYVAMRGADYDWLRPFGTDVVLKDTHGTALGGGPSAGKECKGPKGSGASSTERKGADAGSKEEEGGKGEVVVGGLTLCGVEFEAAPGELLGICGAVGSGKSSLLSALLGELQPLKGSGKGQGCAGKAAQPMVAIELGDGAHANGSSNGANGHSTALPGNGGCGGSTGSDDRGPLMYGRVAYCAQVPWIVAGSVRDNITFGQPYDEAWYGAVVHACCLADDLAGLPLGDRTELGERGINLSGGQKARVALARAVYGRPAVALLDDPLSAVDPRVGRQLFERAIGPGGLLDKCGTTRLLVTHQRQYLPRCDRVMVLRGGRVAALGGWAEVAGLGLAELTAGHGGLAGAECGLGDATVDELVEGESGGKEEGKGQQEEVRQELEEGPVAAAAAGGGGNGDSPPPVTLESYSAGVADAKGGVEGAAMEDGVALPGSGAVDGEVAAAVAAANAVAAGGSSGSSTTSTASPGMAAELALVVPAGVAATDSEQEEGSPLEGGAVTKTAKGLQLPVSVPAAAGAEHQKQKDFSGKGAVASTTVPAAAVAPSFAARYRLSMSRTFGPGTAVWRLGGRGRSMGRRGGSRSMTSSQPSMQRTDTGGCGTLPSPTWRLAADPYLTEWGVLVTLPVRCGVETCP